MVMPMAHQITREKVRWKCNATNKSLLAAWQSNERRVNSSNSPNYVAWV